MSGDDVASSRVRRMLPSVSEVLKELTARAPIEPDVAFRVAREVCAEELKRIRDAGGDSVPLEELVQRALVRAQGGPPRVPFAPPPREQVPLAAPPAPEPIPEPEPEPEPKPVRRYEPVWEPAPAEDAAPLFETPSEAPPVERGAEDPFSETTGAMDLRWEPEGREPFAEANAAPAAGLAEQATEIMPTSELPDTSGGGFLPPAAEAATLVFEPSAPVPFALPAEDDALVPAEPRIPPLVDLRAAMGTEAGPGDETLSRLSREAEAIDLHAVFPAAPPSPAPYPLSPEGARPERVEAAPAPFEDDEDTVLTVPRGGRGKGAASRAGRVVAIVAGLAALAGLGYLLVGLWLERDATPPPVAVARPRPAASPAAKPPAVGAEATPAPEAVPSPAVVTAATEAPRPAPVVAAPPPTAAPVAAAPKPTAAPVAIAPPPAPVSTAPPAPTVVTAAVPRSRDGLVVTKDRAGQPQVFSIHFTSYKDRPSAERDLKRVSAMVGREGYVAEVDLGEKGIWQRVMIGTFATAEEAKAVRAELAEKGTRDMGWVYRVVGPEAADRR
ncbi:MAG: SPOR domain-containing protein [Thermoanaerobaculia bacterium]